MFFLFTLVTGYSFLVCGSTPVILVVLCVDVVVCSPQSGCCCTALVWPVHSVASFPFGVIARRRLKSYVCCSVIGFPARWNSWIYLYSQQFMRPPPFPHLLHCFRSLEVVSAGPNSCLFCNMWFSYAYCGLQFLIWLTCSLYLISVSQPDCPTYSLLHVMHLILYIPLGLLGLSGFLANCLNIVLVDL